MLTVTTYLIIDMAETGSNIRNLIRINDTPPCELQQYLGFSNIQSIYHWMQGRSLPTVDNLILLSHIWNISINDILRCKEISYRKRPNPNRE